MRGVVAATAWAPPRGEILDLRAYLRVLRRHIILLIVFTLGGALTGAGASLFAEREYSARTQLFVAIQNSGTVSELQQGNSFSQARVQSYVRTATTPVVLQPVIDALGLDVSASQLASKVTASADVNTVLITISVVDDSPTGAAAIAQSVGESLVNAITELESPAAGGSSPVRLSVITPASAPLSPSSPNTQLNVLIGLIAGAVIGLGVLTIRVSLDNKVRGEEVLRTVTDAPLLGGITFDATASKKPLLTQVPHQSPRAETFRQIRTNLQFSQVNRDSKTFLVTSALPGEGKSTTATNIAIALAQDGQRVVLVDADLRRPMVAEYLGLVGSAGLTTALLGTSEIDDLLQPWGSDELNVLTAGQLPPNPSELLGSQAMAELIDHLERRFDAVVIDAPPLIPVTDASVLAQRVGGVVLVVGTGKVRTHDLEKSLSSLKLVDADVVGVVLNLLPAKGPDAYGYGYQSYEVQTESGRRGKNRKDDNVRGSHLRTNRRDKSAKPSFEVIKR